jgi:hypothetical protein
VGDPRLPAGEDPAVTVGLGTRPHGGGVGTGLDLGQAVRGEQVAAEQVREPPVDLLGRPGRGQGVAGQHVDADTHGDGAPAAGELLEDLQVDRVRLGAAAVLLRVGQAEQPGLAEEAVRLAGVLLQPGRSLLGLGGRREELLLRDLAHQGEQLDRLVGGQVPLGHGEGSSSTGHRASSGCEGAGLGCAWRRGGGTCTVSGRGCAAAGRLLPA